MEEKMASLLKNKTSKLLKRLKDHKLIDWKRIYKVKEGDRDKDNVRYKTILVIKGFTQKEGVDIIRYVLLSLNILLSDAFLHLLLNLDGKYSIRC